ncbi:unnamed protein product [Candidula unifasciata]|uniref:G-protein coupled receptors family 1 profile domain-containing protein n=1 Tax=Candidula unifasciata TaxID=100452 RepID=A0A8S3ZIQ9_9EUPU|nr:unnamed protein product [Candidula unifasciata]
MDASEVSLTGASTNLSGSYLALFPCEHPNITRPAFTSSRSAATAGRMIQDYFLANITDSFWDKIPRSHSRAPFGGRRRPQNSAEESPQQLVSKQVKDKVCFVFIMVLIPCFCLFGSVGNVLSLRVLVHHRMRNSTNMVLASLAVSDLLFLLHALYFSILRLYALRNPVPGEAFRSMTFPVLGPYGSVITARITTGLTTMLSLERLIAVYFPIKAKVMCSKLMTITCITMIYLVTAVVFIPNALKYHSYYLTINNTTSYTMGLTSLGKNEFFFSIYGNILNILFRLIPILIIIFVNIFIALAIRRTWSFRRSMSSGGSTSYEQNRITLMLLMVSLVFIVCILPGAVHSIIDQIYKQYSRFGQQSNLYDVVRNVTYFLETVNSSVNFVIYMAFSTKFCRTYKQIFCCVENAKTPPKSTRSVVRFSSRPNTRSGSSLTSYRELYLLNQLSNRKVFCCRDRDLARQSGNKSGLLVQSGAKIQDGGKMIFMSKCSNSDSFSGHSSSHSHSGHSNSHSHSNSGHSSKGEQCSKHSTHSLEATPADMYS